MIIEEKIQDEGDLKTLSPAIYYASINGIREIPRTRKSLPAFQDLMPQNVSCPPSMGLITRSL